MQPCRLLIDPPAEGAWNIAVDEALAESASESGAATLRFYQWNAPTLTLGYFQSAADRAQHAASLDCPLVRRASGGGAIIHDRELTYSLAIPIKDRFAERPEKWYDGAHDSLIATLRSINILAERSCCDPQSKQKEQPFLCFERRTAGDVLLNRPEGKGDAKIGGSAQRRSKNALLQHGSILLTTSPCAPELPGIAELSGITLSVEQLIDSWPKALSQELQISLTPGILTEREKERTKEILQQKYANPAWSTRR